MKTKNENPKRKTLADCVIDLTQDHFTYPFYENGELKNVPTKDGLKFITNVYDDQEKVTRVTYQRMIHIICSSLKLNEKAKMYIFKLDVDTYMQLSNYHFSDYYIDDLLPDVIYSSYNDWDDQIYDLNKKRLRKQFKNKKNSKIKIVLFTKYDEEMLKLKKFKMNDEEYKNFGVQIEEFSERTIEESANFIKSKI